ncbi:MAG: hypothetical protein HYU63_06495 [Armatimonadetes bacterium]|nr:hypothetical protein [Armatimonadota bacterium]
MEEKVAIVGVGETLLSPQNIEFSYGELIQDAVSKSLEDAMMNFEQIESIIICSENLLSGKDLKEEIVLEYPKPCLKIGEDGIYGVFNAFMQIVSQLFDPVMVIACGKPSEIIDSAKAEILNLDSKWVKSLEAHPYFIAGLEMNRYFHLRGREFKECAQVVVKSKEKALQNSRAYFGSKITLDQAIQAEMISAPLSSLDIAPWIDGAAAVILASEKKAKLFREDLVFLEALNWGNDAGACLWSDLELGWPIYLENLAKETYQKLNIKKANLEEINFLELEDSFSYQLLQSLEALGFAKKGKALDYFIDNILLINPSSGSLGMGNAFFAKGLIRLIEAVLQLRGSSGPNQLPGPLYRALVQSSYALPNRSGGIIILGRD